MGTRLLAQRLNRRFFYNNGGRYTGSFKSETTNVLVLDRNKAGSGKSQAAVCYKKDCVTPQWILDSVEKGHSLPIGNYKVSLIKVSTPTKAGQAPNASQFNPDCAQLSEISHKQSGSRRNVDETVSSVASSNLVRPRMSTRRNDIRK
jgi:topoisomerase (DNA) II binding protein 1